jgi:hypothetical protein
MSGRNLWGISRAKTPCMCTSLIFQNVTHHFLLFFLWYLVSILWVPDGYHGKKKPKKPKSVDFFLLCNNTLGHWHYQNWACLLCVCVCVCVFMHPYSKNARSLCHYPTPPMWWSLMIILFSVPIRKSNHGNALRQKNYFKKTRKMHFPCFVFKLLFKPSFHSFS